MSDLHPLGVTSQNREIIEAVGPSFIMEGLLNAQKQSWDVFDELREASMPGMTEIEGAKLAVELFAKAGSTKHWHRPQIRFGEGTALTYYDALRSDYKLQRNDLVHFDLGPVWTDEKTGIEYEGDVGDSFVFGENPEAQKLVDFAHELFNLGVKYWKESSPDGVQLYQHLTLKAQERGYTLIEKIDGHRVGDYPHTKFTKQRLSELRFVPKETLWILEFQLLHPTLKMGAFFEDFLR